MGTNVRPELVKNNKYYISKHRFYELKHFCLQFPQWVEEKAWLESGVIKSPTPKEYETYDHSDPTADKAIIMAYYSDKISMVETAAEIACDDLADYILAAVTKGHSFAYLQNIMGIPCCKDVYYDNYRRFFSVLDKMEKGII